jgi:hypothetical protein
VKYTRKENRNEPKCFGYRQVSFNVVASSLNPRDFRFSGLESFPLKACFLYAHILFKTYLNKFYLHDVLFVTSRGKIVIYDSSAYVHASLLG